MEKSSVPARTSSCLEPLEPLESSLAKVDMYLKKLCPTKSESADFSETGRCSGSTSYVDLPECNIENKCTEKDVDVDTSPKKKKSNWGISLKEYKKKLRLADKLPSMWEQRTGTDLVRPLLQAGGGSGKEWDIFQDDDSEGDDKHSESGESQESDREEEGDSDSSDVNESDGDKDPDWVFNFLIYHSKNNLKKDGDKFDLKTLRKKFRINYGNILKWMYALRQNKIHKKVMYTAEDLRNSSADFDYDESIDAAIAKRKYLLDRLVTEEDLPDSEDALSDSEDELSDMEDNDTD